MTKTPTKNHIAELNGQFFTLDRFPPNQADASLQAWDAADQYLLQQAGDNQVGDNTTGLTFIVNDSFGALACALADRRPLSIGDSYIAELATRHNLHGNGLDETRVTFISSLHTLPSAPALVLIKIPKQLSLLEQQLAALRQVVTPQTRIIAAAKTRDIHNSTLALFAKILGPASSSPAWKKARLINCTFSAPPLQEASTIISWPLQDSDFTIHNHASVFSRSSLDIGARLFMRHLPGGIAGEMVDLGCGNGVIGLQLLAKNPQGRVLFVDESHMAVASSRLNVESNLPYAMVRSEFMVNNALAGVSANRFQAIFCNPPFHQQHAITDHIAWQMFNDARRCLSYGGGLYIVGNRHLDYLRKLKRLFGNCTVIGSNRKFVVMKAMKLCKNKSVRNKFPAISSHG